MKKFVKNKITTWIITILIIANITTLVFFWLGHFRIEEMHSPREFLAKQLNFSESQKTNYFNLAKEHNRSANILRAKIKLEKDAFFKQLQSDQINDSIRNSIALKVSLSIQSLDILTFEHFKKVRSLCSAEQKLKFDELIQEMFNTVNNPQQGPPPFLKK